MHSKVKWKNEKEWRKANPDRYRETSRRGMLKYATKLRTTILEMLDNKCVRCGFADERALQIDHINGGGRKDIKGTGGASYYIKVVRSIVANEKKFQLLCANCNWIKRRENNEVSRKYPKH